MGIRPGHRRTMPDIHLIRKPVLHNGIHDVPLPDDRLIHPPGYEEGHKDRRAVQTTGYHSSGPRHAVPAILPAHDVHDHTISADVYAILGLLILVRRAEQLLDRRTVCPQRAHGGALTILHITKGEPAQDDNGARCIRTHIPDRLLSALRVDGIYHTVHRHGNHYVRRDDMVARIVDATGGIIARKNEGPVLWL